MLDFDTPAYRFNRSVLDNKPYQQHRTEDSVVIIHNCVGIPSENIDISIQYENNVAYLVIQGSYNDEKYGNNYSVNSRFRIYEEQIDRIEWTAENGILNIEVKFKKPESKKIPIAKKKASSTKTTSSKQI